MRVLLVACIALLALSSFKFSSVSSTNTIEAKDSNFNIRIQLCEYNTIIPVKKVELLREIGAKPIKSTYGSIYVTKPYASEDDAKNDLPKFRALGFEDAQAVVEKDDELLTVDNYHDLYKNDNTTSTEKTENGVVRIWK